MRTSIMMRCPKCAENSQLDNIHLLDHTFKREWVGLTDEQRRVCVNTPFVADQWAYIEAKLKELNSA